LGVLLLADEGLIDLDTSVQHYLPDFQILDSRASEITVRQLLNQTSGLPGNFSEPLLYHQGSDAMKEMLAALDQVRLSSAPSSSFEYANMNYAVLGALVEAVTGTSFEDYMEQEVFTPLGASYTTLYPDKAAGLGRAEGHQPMFGQVVTKNIPYFRSVAPAGWVMSSAEDMAKWLFIQLNKGSLDGEQLFPADIIREMQAPASQFSEDGEEMGYGMGLYIRYGADGEPIIWHGGDTPNFLTDMLILPSYQFGVVVLTNSQASTLGHGIAPGIANLILGLELKPTSAPWWAHWKMIDNMAIWSLGPISLLILGWGVYTWQVWRQFRSKKRRLSGSPLTRDMLPRWQLALYVTPLALLALSALAGYLVVQILFGYNFYEVLVLFQVGAPPGIYLSGVLLILILFLWGFLLSFIALFTRTVRVEA
jgi:CubicO group peptidase (beta-lactamase class C family)